MKNEIKFTQPDKKVHDYNSIVDEKTGSIEGYNVKGDRETKKWTAFFNGTQIGEPVDSRPAAVALATDHAYPDQKTADAASSGKDEKVIKLNSREYAVLTAVKSDGGKPVGLARVTELTKFAPEVVMSAIATLGRRGYIKLDGFDSTITEQGDEVYANYVPSSSVSGPRRAADPATAEAQKAAREARVRSKPGFDETRDAYLLEPITDLELEELKLDTAEAAIAQTKGLQRMYPLSKGVDQRLAANIAARDKVLESIEALKNGGERIKAVRPSSEDTPDVSAEAPADAPAEPAVEVPTE